MAQWIVYIVELLIVAGFIGAILYRPTPEKRDLLRDPGRSALCRADV